MQIKSEFRIHNVTLYVDKFINYSKGLKLLISLGVDYNMNNPSGQEESVQVIKIWDF